VSIILYVDIRPIVLCPMHPEIVGVGQKSSESRIPFVKDSTRETSVNFDGSIDIFHKSVGCEETDSSSQQRVHRAGQEAVGEEQQT
jgi:hypothetical protein